MGLTDRSRLNCIKYRQQKLDNRNRNLSSATGLEPAIESAIEPASETALDPLAREKAWKKYLHAKAIYEETKAIEHWQYLQECISDYEKTLRPNLAIKAS